ncbi:MAG: hypothetical protein FJX72_11425 [Armatimonadetes bacterium]|nr:hypothetical protein [Armatimonadota bacterium]
MAPRVGSDEQRSAPVPPPGERPAPPGRALTEKQAIEAVRAQPEVAEWLRAFTGDLAERPRFTVEPEHGPVYVIHVYEDVPDPSGGGHTATLGWFEVDKRTGEVTRVEI